MANAAFSPKDFKAWVIEETDTGNNWGLSNISLWIASEIWRYI